MKVGEIVKGVMKDRNVSYLKVAESLGYKHASAISNRLDDKRSIQVDILLNILQELDCELVVRSTTKDKTEWVIDQYNIKEK